MKTYCYLFILMLFLSDTMLAQSKTDSILLSTRKNLVSIRVQASQELYMNKRSLRVVDGGGDSEVKFVKITSLDFQNGVIEMEISGKPSDPSSEQARGFVGIAFRINQDDSAFECIYLRPTNGRANDQVRRNHSVQYISYPDFPWFKLRKEFPEKYESYVDLVPGEWTKVKLEIHGSQARLYVHGNAQPTLIVNDLKHGPDAKGAIGLWIGPGTDAHFSDLIRITHK
jgi:hypothetical protein